MQNLIKIIVVILLLSVKANAADKVEVFNSVKSKFSNINSINLVFTDPENNLRGEITAAKNNKYFINVFGRSIISDGSTIWNYSHRDSNVLISNYNDFDSELSVESLFFELMGNIYPVKISSYKSSKGVSGYKIHLKPKEDYQNEHNIKSIEIVVESKSYDILEISYIQDYAKFRWIISNIDINPEIEQSTFTFIKNKNIEIIDLR